MNKKYEGEPEFDKISFYPEKELIEKKKEIGDKLKLKDLRKILTFTTANEKYQQYAMASPFTKATVALEVKPDGKFLAYFGAGPATDLPENYIIYTNTKNRRELKGGWL